MRRLAILCVVATLPTWATACKGKCQPGAADPELELGWGEESFDALDPDEPRMEIIHGPQDGYHLPIATDATGLSGADLLGSHLQGWVDGVLHGDTRPWIRMRCNPNTRTLQSWNNLLIWDVTPDQLDGKVAHIEVTVTDVDGRTATSEADVLMFYPGGFVDTNEPIDTGDSGDSGDTGL